MGMRSETVFIDSNVVIDFFMGEGDLREGAKALRRKFPDWMTLPWCRYEFGNVLRTCIRRGKIDERSGAEMLRKGVVMLRYCDECADEVVLAEANASNLSFYDAAYVARARALGVRLYTRDGDILKNCPEIAVPIRVG
ncbi:MAG: PIN domain-containing protein [Puniceicoccaceae bacterium]|nr:MAG: PIN domain-containing protein [Puniceicoccaceae bacterium]